MSSYDNRYVKIEAGQIMNPESFPPPNELVCIQVPKVFDQVALRDCTLRAIQLTAGPGVIAPKFAFESTDDFDIIEVKVLSNTDSMTKPGYKKLKLYVKVRYQINYTDGVNHLSTFDEVVYNLVINEIYCPNCAAQIGVIHYPHDQTTLDEDGLLIKVEALVESFNDAVNSVNGAMSLDLGAFFVIKCACIVQLLMPAYGYCPVPPEQSNPLLQNCEIFRDKNRTKFPTTFFPDQKWNPLDSGNC